MSLNALLLTATLLAPAFAQETKLVSSAPAPAKSFGQAVAVWGDTILVGEPEGPTSTNVGAAHVFVHDGVSWTYQAQLVPLDTAEFQFGFSVALDGDTALVGTNSDAVYVFERTASTWAQTEKLRAHDTSSPPINGFGGSVALLADLAVIGAPTDSPSTGFASGSVYLYARSGTDWNFQAKLFPVGFASFDQFGASVALSSDTILVGDPFDDDLGDVSGAAYLFKPDGLGWIESVKLLPADGQTGDLFGEHVALSGDTSVVSAASNVLAAGAPGSSGAASAEGSVYVFERDLGGPGNWGEARRITVNDPDSRHNFGTAVALSGDRLLVGAPTDRGQAVSNIEALAFDANTGTLYGADTLRDLLVTIDPATGASQPIGDLGIDLVRGLAYDATSSTLFGVDATLDELLVIDTAAGSATSVGSLGFTGVESLAFDVASATLFGADRDSDQLISIDTSTGAATAIGPFGFAFPAFQDVGGLSFDDATATLYGVRSAKDPTATHRLLTINTATGAATVINNTGLKRLSALALAGGAGLRGAQDVTDQLVALDMGANPGSTVGPFFTLELCVGTVYVFERDAGGPGAWGQVAALVAGDGEQLDNYGVRSVATWGDTVVASAEGDDDGGVDAGAAYTVQFGGSAVSYCTAGTSASGCQATLSATGSASATKTSGFTLSSTGIEGQKDGIFFFGTSGRQASAWGNGSSFQCVVPPVRRAGLLVGSGTAGSCDGAFAQDLNALWCPTCPKAGANPGAGATVQAQLWYRDPQNTSSQTTSLSDAIEFAVGP